MSQTLKWIKKMFVYAKKRQWYETYWAIDLHGVVLKPDYRKDSPSVDYYPFAKETLQLMSERDDFKMFMFTSSYPDEIEIYVSAFKQDKIFKSIIKII